MKPKRSGHIDHVTRGLVPAIVWQLVAGFLVLSPVLRKPTRRRRAQDVPLPFERPA